MPEVDGLWIFVPVNTLPDSVKHSLGTVKFCSFSNSENSDLRNYFVEATTSARSFAAGGLLLCLDTK
ncbi:hypothetical protein [Mucilaginibacter ginsenosidivorax]|uniref:Uncharacterized protein n=1 Tax=Mucilaginibacter ginsenosidivorax TaxID=862126 RepID=A0A5B8W622_9SPHI|nr:hypothetical protein [Mucilaginibacter ginsenosidivorax]QEC78362.1 hypothetical protein FSB76_21345 [Mucilaginibacter ginsenosidivorax]